MALVPYIDLINHNPNSESRIRGVGTSKGEKRSCRGWRSIADRGTVPLLCLKQRLLVYIIWAIWLHGIPGMFRLHLGCSFLCKRQRRIAFKKKFPAMSLKRPFETSQTVAPCKNCRYLRYSETLVNLTLRQNPWMCLHAPFSTRSKREINYIYNLVMWLGNHESQLCEFPLED